MPTCASDTLRPITRGGLCSGSKAARIISLPFVSPEAPRPVIARLTMSIGNDRAAPQSADLSSKVVKKTKKDHC